MNFHLAWFVEAEVKQLSIAQIVQPFFESVTSIGGDLIDTLRHTALGVETLVVRVLVDFNLLRARVVRYFHNGRTLRRCIGSSHFLRILLGNGGVHLGFLQPADDLFHLKPIGPKRFRLHDLPFVLRVLPQFHSLPLGNDLHAAQLLGIEGQQPLIAQILRRAIQTGLRTVGHREHTRILAQLRKDAPAGWRCVP